MLSVIQKRYPFTPSATPEPSFTMNKAVLTRGETAVFTCADTVPTLHVSVFIDGYRNYVLDPTGEHGGDRRASLFCVSERLTYDTAALPQGDYVAVLFGDGWRDYQRTPFSVIDPDAAPVPPAPPTTATATSKAPAPVPPPTAISYPDLSGLTVREAPPCVQEGAPVLRFTVDLRRDYAATLPPLTAWGALVIPTAALCDNDIQPYAPLVCGGQYPIGDTVYTPTAVPAEDTSPLAVTVVPTDPDGDPLRRAYTVRGYLCFTDVHGARHTRYSAPLGADVYGAARRALDAGTVPPKDQPALRALTDAVRRQADTDYRQAEKITLFGSPDDPRRWVYRLAGSHLRGREVTVETDRGSAPVEIMFLTDTHLSADNRAGVPALRRVMDYAATADRLVIGGDVMDRLSDRNLVMLQQELWDAAPQVRITPGNHDYASSVQTPAQAFETLQRAWRHDIHYFSEVLGDKVMLILLNNATGVFREEDVTPLERDLARARENGYAVLLFTHGSLYTGAPGEDSLDGRVTVRRFSARSNAAPPHRPGGATGRMLDRIAANGDIIRGVFNGHAHQDFYSEIRATAPDGTPAPIPQYTVSRAVEDAGRFLRITVR